MTLILFLAGSFSCRGPWRRQSKMIPPSCTFPTYFVAFEFSAGVESANPFKKILPYRGEGFDSPRIPSCLWAASNSCRSVPEIHYSASPRISVRLNADLRVTLYAKAKQKHMCMTNVQFLLVSFYASSKVSTLPGHYCPLINP